MIDIASILQADTDIHTLSDGRTIKNILYVFEMCIYLIIDVM